MTEQPTLAVYQNTNVHTRQFPQKPDKHLINYAQITLLSGSKHPKTVGRCYKMHPEGLSGVVQAGSSLRCAGILGAGRSIM